MLVSLRADGLLGRVPSKILWTLLLVLTALLIRWPVSPSPYDPMPVQSAAAIRAIHFFVPLMYAWALILLALLLSPKRTAAQGLAICLIFTLVFSLFWGFASPWGSTGDSSWLMGHVGYLIKTGRLPPRGVAPFVYFDFPALSLLGLSITKITGLDLFRASQAYLIASGLLLTAALYASFRHLTGSPSRAAASVILAILCSSTLAAVTIQFAPINLGTMYIAVFLLVVVRMLVHQDNRAVPLLVVLAMAATVGYIFNPVYFSLVILGGYVLCRIAKVSYTPSFGSVLLPVVLLLAWEIYQTNWSFPALVGQLHQVWQDERTFGWLRPTSQELRTNAGPGYPWWGNAARLFWWVALFGGGTLFLLWEGIRLRVADSRRRAELIFLAGSLATVVVGSLTTVGAVHGGFSRYIWVAPLFLAPAVVTAFARPRARIFAALFVLACLAALVPTFLIDEHIFSGSRTYPSDIAASRFLAASYGSGEGLTLDGFPGGPAVSFVFTPSATFNGLYVEGASEDEAWRALRGELAAFRSSGPKGTIGVDLPKTRAGFIQYFGVGFDDPHWGVMEDELNTARRVYDAGTLQFYEP